MILATLENMRKYRRENKTIPSADGGSAIIVVNQPFAYSRNTDERYSADPGDYWNMPEGEPLRDSEGEPMILVFESTRYVDADEA